MTEFKQISIPAEDYDALGIGSDTVLETYVTDDGALVIRVVTDEDLDSLICGDDCEGCPIREEATP